MSPNTELRLTKKGKGLLKSIWKMKEKGTYLESDRAEVRFGLLFLLSEELKYEPDFSLPLSDLSDEINAGGELEPPDRVIAQIAESLVRSGHLGLAIPIEEDKFDDIDLFLKKKNWN